MSAYALQDRAAWRLVHIYASVSHAATHTHTHTHAHSHTHTHTHSLSHTHTHTHQCRVAQPRGACRQLLACQKVAACYTWLKVYAGAIALAIIRTVVSARCGDDDAGKHHRASLHPACKLVLLRQLQTPDSTAPDTWPPCMANVHTCTGGRTQKWALTGSMCSTSAHVHPQARLPRQECPGLAPVWQSLSAEALPFARAQHRTSTDPRVAAYHAAGVP